MKARFLAVASLMAVATAAFAEDYPTHPVRFLVGWSTGGTVDSLARVLAPRLSQILKQTFIVENRPGAGGTVGTYQVAKAAPDGYTLMLADIGQLAIAPYIYKDLPYDPVKDFTPIGLAALVPLVVISNSKTTNIKTMADLVSYAKAHPGKLNYASPGIGGIHHIAMEVLKSEAGIDMVHVPYKGSGQSMPGLLGGEVQVMMSGFTMAAPYGKSGQVNLLGVTSPKRFSDAPNVPAISEFYKGYDFTSEVGIIGPAGLSPEVVAKLSAALKTALEEPEAIGRIKMLGDIPSWLSAQDYGENIRQNLKKYKRAAELANITPN